MINANELRIGNIFYPIETREDVSLYVPIPFIVKEIEETKVRGHRVGQPSHQVLKYSDFWINEISPIPLTPEILIACGFKKFSHEPGYTLGTDEEKSERCDEYSLSKIIIMDWGNGFILSNSFSFDLRIEVKHLHQLQNLYFALTGEELIINL